MNKHKERQFQTELGQHLDIHGYMEGDASRYDRELVLYPETLFLASKPLNPKPMKRCKKEKELRLMKCYASL